MPLPTFVHISDIHISRISEEKRRRQKRPPTRFQGLLGHSENSLRYLGKFFRALRQEEPHAQLIVTGDLSRVGHPEEFAVADQFLGSTYSPPKGGELGLGVGDWKERAIPGNHDHWPGHPTIIGPPRAAPLWEYFRDLPLVEPVLQLGNSRQLRFLRIDTDADVNPYLRERFCAHGNFVSQLKKLTAKLAKLGQNENEIRVLCLHHSPTYRGFFLQINDASRGDLHRFVVQHRVAVLLCGHIHRPAGVQEFQPLPIDSTVVIEACCGTTTQFDPSIAKEAQFVGLFHWQNSLLVHRLREFSGEIHWEREIYLETRAGFVRADRLKNDIAAVTRYKVWPWPPRVLPQKTTSRRSGSSPIS